MFNMRSALLQISIIHYKFASSIAEMKFFLKFRFLSKPFATN